MDYPTSIPGAPDAPMYATVIGKYSMDTTKIEFNKVELIGYYGVKDEKWMANQNHGNQEKLLKSMPIKVYLHQQDSEGDYYASRMYDRIATRDRCTSGTRDPISEVYYVLKPAEITELQQMKGFMGKLRP
jgi:hypothetical protein